MNKNIFVILIIVLFSAGCSDLFEPQNENILDKDLIYKEPNFGLNLLTNAYVKIPSNNWSFNDVATDDAVSNDVSNVYLKAATGQWSAINNPFNRWTECFHGVQYVNIVLGELNKMKFSEDAQIDMLFKDRIKGEAFGLRGLLLYNLLQVHAGWVNGKLMGIPVFLTELTPTSDFNLPRLDFKSSVKQIYNDLDSAKKYLPNNYVELTNASGIPAKYVGMGMTDYGKYNRVFGVKFLGLMNATIAQAVRSQTALMAASPAFSAGSDVTWEDAAVMASEIINAKGKIAGFPSAFNSGVAWYRNATEINALSNGSNPPEVLWRTGVSTDNNLEGANFPPTLFGTGRINPTQNLVDAFPDKNGYPISASSVYDPANPYANRDPRLKEFILVHGEKAGVPNVAIDITSGDDAVNVKETSTRTGYYMRKLLRQDVNYNPNGRNTQKHIKPRIRYTEIYLNFAEAANEAWGPLADPKGLGYNAYDVIKAVRKRALGLNADPYLESIKSDPIAMRQLIRNERRLELCFEGFRFWDLRRWNVTLQELNTPAKGIKIKGTLATPDYSDGSVVVEQRVYKSYMLYGPIPQTEVLKYNKLEQNEGW